MALAYGTRLGPYELRTAIGAGGMGEVYRARDLRLDRDVAIKVLPQGEVSDAAASARFHREARAIAALNHPNICTLHDIGQEGETSFLVMELIDGESLAARIGGRPLPVRTALAVAQQIADALDRAHRAGIAHRDLKPANVMLATEAGHLRVKLLDFGLAKPIAVKAVASESNAAAPTAPAEMSMTAEGVVVGTLPYIAPELFEGHAPDHRSDIWALGCVLYEMLTGARAFGGASGASVMAAIVGREPAPLSVAQPGISSTLEHVVARCLAKDPEARWQSARDLAMELRWLGHDGAGAAAVPVIAHPSSRHRYWWTAAVAAIALAALGAIAIGAGWFRGSRVETGAPVVFDIPAPSTQLDSIAVSPDGRYVAFVGTAADSTALLVRELGTNQARPLAGTADASRPFWAPDSTALGYFTPTELRVVDLNGAAPRLVAQLPRRDAIASSGSWSDDGRILFGQIGGAGIGVVSARGGAIAEITSVSTANGGQNHHYPQWLPGSRAFLYLRTRGPQLEVESEVVLRSIDTGQERVVLKAYSRIEFARPNWLVYVRNQALVAQPIDLSAGAPAGDAVVLAPAVLRLGELMSLRAMSASAQLLAYRTPGVSTARPRWFSRAGLAGEAMTTERSDNVVADPTGTWLAADDAATGAAGGDIWVTSIPRGAESRLTFDPATDRHPVFSPDGQAVVFTSGRQPAGLYRKRTNGSGQEEIVAETGADALATDWSRDGRHIVYQKGYDLWLVTLGSPSTTSPLIQDSGGQEQARFSPGGEWLAYTSNETGRAEVFVRELAQGGAKRQISSTGGSEPRWSSDGREMYYLGADGWLIAVELSPGPELAIGPPRRLFQTGLMDLVSAKRGYSVADSGQRFLINVSDADERGLPITVVVGWQRLVQAPTR